MNRNMVVLNQDSVAGENREPGETARYRKMINDHIQLIERQCFRVIKQQLKSHSAYDNPGTIENEALELSNITIDALQKDDYKALRQFKGTAKLSTYITAVIARKAVDQLRKKLGRNRGKERGKKLETNPVVKNGFLTHTHNDGEDEEEIIIPDTQSNPENLLIEEQRKEKLEKALHGVIDELNGEERLILRMRFPENEEEKPQRIERISTVLGISEKAVYKRISRLMEKCRDVLNQKGVHPDDLF